MTALGEKRGFFEIFLDFFLPEIYNTNIRNCSSRAVQFNMDATSQESLSVQTIWFAHFLFFGGNYGNAKNQ